MLRRAGNFVILKRAFGTQLLEKSVACGQNKKKTSSLNTNDR